MSGSTDPSYGTCQISSERRGSGVVYVTVVGEVDLYTAPQLESALRESAHSFIVDLTDCGFIDSTALGVLVAARTRVGRLELVAPGIEVRRTLELSGLDRLLTVHGSRSSAGGIPGA